MLMFCCTEDSDKKVDLKTKHQSADKPKTTAPSAKPQKPKKKVKQTFQDTKGEKQSSVLTRAQRKRMRKQLLASRWNASSSDKEVMNRGFQQEEHSTGKIRGQHFWR